MIRKLKQIMKKLIKKRKIKIYKRLSSKPLKTSKDKRMNVKMNLVYLNILERKKIKKNFKKKVNLISKSLFNFNSSVEPKLELSIELKDLVVDKNSVCHT